RYYYNKRILHKTKGKRFTYKFNFNKLVMPNYPFINIRPNGVVPQSAPPVPSASSRFHFPPLDPHSPTDDPSRFPPGTPLLPPSSSSAAADPLGDAERQPNADSPEWRRDLLASHPPPPPPSVGSGGVSSSSSSSHHKRKADVVLPLFSRPGIFPDPHSPFAVSPLAARGAGASGGLLNVPISPALSLTPTLFSYSPSPGLSPFAGSSCFSFNPEEMKHFLHSQACSVFNYHLSPRTFPRYPLVVPPLQCPAAAAAEEAPHFPIKLQPPPAGRKNRERPESRGDGGEEAGGRPRVKVEKMAEEEEEAGKGGNCLRGEMDSVRGEMDSVREKEEPAPKSDEWNSTREDGNPFPRPAAPAWIPSAPPSDEASEKGSRDPSADAGGAPEKREDAVMPPKLRLKRRWNGSGERHAELPEEN
ncbi:ETV3 protein, partial [Pitta sordida]|nr:ETV3 protein [Pitta sordida]